MDRRSVFTTAVILDGLDCKVFLSGTVRVVSLSVHCRPLARTEPSAGERGLVNMLLRQLITLLLYSSVFSSV